MASKLTVMGGTNSTKDLVLSLNSDNELCLDGVAVNPVGSLLYWYGTTAPSGYLECNGSTFSQTTYPLLYKRLGNSNRLPDFRECVVVGTGTNSTHSIATHDTYTLGQFKDDLLRTHMHYGAATKQNWGVGSPWGSNGVWGNTTEIDRTLRTQNASGTGIGNCTHGKQKGAMICIKAK